MKNLRQFAKGRLLPLLKDGKKRRVESYRGKGQGYREKAQVTLKSKISEEIKTYLKQGEKEKVSALRLLMAAIKQKEIDEKKELDDIEIAQTVNKLAKQRKESISQYKAANRPDLVQKEEFELKILSDYLPSQLDESEIVQVVNELMSEIGPKTLKEMGTIMGQLSQKLSGRADLSVVSRVLREKLKK